jgi:hypothetical protein
MAYSHPSMQRKLVGGLLVGACATLVASACTLPSPDKGSGGQAGVGAAGSGSQVAGTTQADGGVETGGSTSAGGVSASGGTGGTGGTGGKVGTAGTGEDPDAGGAGGEPSTCQGDACLPCTGAMPAAGTKCGECGTYACNPDGKTTSCSDPKLNDCGGCTKLVAAPGATCGDCGKYECSTDKESVICKDPGKNACGGCGTLASQPNSSCGTCGDWKCSTDKTTVQCSGANANACGGCGTLANAPGTACGQCGKYECSSDKASTACQDPGKNACGGCAVLSGTLGAACGNGKCGKLACSSDKNSLVCQGDVPNACGGCATLTPSGATKGASCGSCSRTWSCNADLNSLSCTGTTPNACGGCSTLSGTLGASCGACSVTACATDKESLVCNSQCTGAQVCVSGLNQCKTPDCSAADSCGKPDGAGGTCTNTKGKCVAKPNSTATCAGSSCAYTCSKKTLSCSTTAEPACGSWNFESNTVEGWSVDQSATSAASGSLYLATPPGSGAGTYSLAVKADGVTKANADCVAISAKLCAAGAPATGLQGKFHISVWYTPTDGKGAPSGPAYMALQPSGGGTDNNTPANTWFDVPSFDVAGANVTGATVYICGLTGHKGTLFFDNIYFE